jgi:uncharacterized pyridoxal phosphate-containing UPF0001 family protein
MGMSSDYLEAQKIHLLYLRIGSNIFGKDLKNFYFSFLLINS